ncbi:SDR family NAD(P)-dependent oxidoreductase [Promethearchaeum syntrophicum]|uniref:SDR family NAD(P)-dependent oxidoreductase n=1 Tax=Promethearchaeum syntrophicum TaxID=2594042 RepID=A0A5B9DEB2_9ARCH|nr:SDR family oxidoreductase [Candidatus Prometheoarchaeum syntrophicum]
MGKFDGKICLVGGNLGKMKKDAFKIGLGGIIAKQMIEQGAQEVCLVDTDFAITKACAELIGGNVKAYECDFFTERTYEIEAYVDDRGKNKTKVVWKNFPALKMVEDIVAEFGKLDVLITNFDKFERKRVDQTDMELFDYLRDQNVWPTFHLLSAVRDQLSTQRKTQGTYAKVVILTSMLGKAGMSAGAIWAAFKGAMIGLTKSLAREFGRFANVNAVAIGPLSEKKMQGPKDRVKGAYLVTSSDLSNQPMTFEKVSPMVLLLASDDAIGINGQSISVDGGLWLKLEQ